MGWIKKFIKEWKRQWVKSAENSAKRRATDFFNVKEMKGDLWLTHGGEPVMPIRMVTDNDSIEGCLDTIAKLRTAYVELYITKGEESE